jgi:Dolichyl-phosphate-mannose-protein mannosyltransferase
MISVNGSPSDSLLAKTAPLVLVALPLTSSAVWILNDQRVWPWDSAHYGDWTLILWHARASGLNAWLDAMIHAIGTKPPLIVWGGQFFVPLTELTGEVESALLFFNILLAGSVLTLMFIIARNFGAGMIGSLAAVIACGGSPIFIALTHLYWADLTQGFAATIAILAAWRIERGSLTRALALSLSTVALGFISKASSMTFVLPMLTYIAVVLIVTRRQPKPATSIIDGAKLFAAVLILGATVTWYAANWTGVVRHFIDATVAESTLLYGSPVDLSRKLNYWTVWLGKSLSPFVLLQMCIAAIIVIALGTAMVRVFRQEPSEWAQASVESGTLFGLALAGTVVATLLAYSLQINEDLRYLMPLVPLIGALLGWSFAIIRNRLVVTLVVAALIFNTAVNHLYAHGINLFRIAAHPWMSKVDRNTRDKDLLMNAIRSSCRPETADRLNVVAVAYLTLSGPSADFYSAKYRYFTGYGCTYVQLGESDVQRALDWIIELQPAYVLTVAPEKQSPAAFMNYASSRGVAERLANDRRFELAAGSGDYLLIYRRRPGP